LTDRQLLTDDERRTLLGIPSDRDDLARLFTLTPGFTHRVHA
jgi:hypothetical protein